jgi:hypothetical protein
MNSSNFVSRLVALVMAGAILTTTAAAQVRGHQTYDIPFAFLVGKTICPAGRYTVTTAASSGVLRIQKEDGSKSVMFLARLEQATGGPKRSSLVFHRYGDTRFLSQVRPALESSYAQLNRSSVEDDLAMRWSKPQETVVMARAKE